MRPIERIDRMLALLGQRWHATPDLRLGQLIVAVAGVEDVFALEDDVMEKRLSGGDFADTPDARTVREPAPRWVPPDQVRRIDRVGFERTDLVMRRSAARDVAHPSALAAVFDGLDLPREEGSAPALSERAQAQIREALVQLTDPGVRVVTLADIDGVSTDGDIDALAEALAAEITRRGLALDVWTRGHPRNVALSKRGVM